MHIDIFLTFLCCEENAFIFFLAKKNTNKFYTPISIDGIEQLYSPLHPDCRGSGSLIHRNAKLLLQLMSFHLQNGKRETNTLYIECACTVL